MYLTGYFHSRTERPEASWVPATGEPALFCPGLDRDRVAGGLAPRRRAPFFDFPHAESDGDPGAASVPRPSGTVDLWRWMLRAVDRRGVRMNATPLTREWCWLTV